MLKSTNFRGASVNYILRKKSKRTIVLLHGFLEAAKVWDEYIKELAKNNTVIAIDLPGHGKSDCLGYIHKMEDLAECVMHILKENNLRKAIFVGHSMGGYVALALADKYPDAITGLCLFNSTAKPDSPQKKKDRDRAIDVVKKNHQLFIQQAIPNLFVEQKSTTIRGAIKRTLNIAINTPKQGIIASLEGMKIRPNREIILKFAPYPVFCLAGKEDKVVPYEDLIGQSKLPENGSYYLSEKGGHMCFFEDKYPCLKALQKFIVSCKKL